MRHGLATVLSLSTTSTTAAFTIRTTSIARGAKPTCQHSQPKRTAALHNRSLGKVLCSAHIGGQENDSVGWWRRDVWREVVAMLLSAALLLQPLYPVEAAFEQVQEDGTVVSREIDYGCLACKCGWPMIKLAAEPRALHELSCLVQCGIDDVGCAMKCGDMYKDDVLHEFHVCAIAKHKCIPQRTDVAPKLPDVRTLPAAFDPSKFSGEWYITHGLNPLFDCFDCQRHQVSGSEGRMVVDVEYDVTSPSSGATFTRTLRQDFRQDPTVPGKLRAEDPEYLHEKDEWYILDADPDRYMLVYYTGCNDAWCGYTGGVIYSRGPELDPESRERLTAVAAQHGIKLDQMCPTDNSCSLRRPRLPALGAA